MPWNFASIHFPECRNYCHHSSEVVLTSPRVVSLYSQQCPHCPELSIQNMRHLRTPCRSRGRRQPLVYLKLILGTHQIIRLASLQCAKVKVRELAGVRNRPGVGNQTLDAGDRGRPWAESGEAAPPATHFSIFSRLVVSDNSSARHQRRCLSNLWSSHSLTIIKWNWICVYFSAL